MAGIKGRSGPPGNQNSFKHGLAALGHRQAAGALSPAEQSIREEILAGLTYSVLSPKAWRQSSRGDIGEVATEG